jgi:hypothetical protein
MKFEQKGEGGGGGGTKTPGVWEVIREVGGFAFGRNDAIVVTLKRVLNDNIATYWYSLYEHWVDKDGVAHPKKKSRKDQWGKEKIALSMMIKADDLDRVKNWQKIFEDIAIDQVELAEQIHNPEEEKLNPPSDPPDTPLGLEENEDDPF